MKNIKNIDDISENVNIGILNLNKENPHITYYGTIIEITYKGKNIKNIPYVGGFIQINGGESVPPSLINKLMSFTFTEGDNHIVLL